MIQLKPITDKSWILTAEGQNIGILSQTTVGNYSLLSKGSNTVFSSRQELTNFFNDDIFNNVIETEKKEIASNLVNGYLVEEESVIEAESTDGLPLYYKNAKKTVLYSAGWYCLNFPKGYQPAFCPKLSTLQTYGFEGPFKSEEEMRLALRRLKS